MAAPAAAALAGVAALGAYINAKYHVAQDVRALRKKRVAMKWYAELGVWISVLLPASFSSF